MDAYDSIIAALHRFEDGAIDAAAFLRELALSVAEELLCERVGIWAFEVHDDRLALRCLHQYDLRGLTYTEGRVLSGDAMTGYFSALAESGVLVASDAREHPATRQLADTYLVPFDIHSILDVALAANGQWTGILCCERVDNVRPWYRRDVAFLRTFATRTSLVIERLRAGRFGDSADTASVRMESGSDVSIALQPHVLEPDRDRDDAPA